MRQKASTTTIKKAVDVYKLDKNETTSQNKKIQPKMVRKTMATFQGFLKSICDVNCVWVSLDFSSKKKSYDNVHVFTLYLRDDDFFWIWVCRTTENGSVCEFINFPRQNIYKQNLCVLHICWIFIHFYSTHLTSANNDKPVYEMEGKRWRSEMKNERMSKTAAPYIG